MNSIAIDFLEMVVDEFDGWVKLDNFLLVRLSDASLLIALTASEKSGLPVIKAFLPCALRASFQLFSLRCRSYHVAMQEVSSLAIWSRRLQVSSFHPMAC